VPGTVSAGDDAFAFSQRYRIACRVDTGYTVREMVRVGAGLLLTRADGRGQHDAGLQRAALR